MIVAIHQPNYLPWIGFYQKMALSDTFVFLDDVQFPRNKGFSSRVKIKRADGPNLLSIPVKEKKNLKKLTKLKLPQNSIGIGSIGKLSNLLIKRHLFSPNMLRSLKMYIFKIGKNLLI